MPISSRKLGPGTLKLGTAGTALQVEAQLAACTLTVSESVTTTGDKLKALSGDVKDGTSETVDLTYSLTGTFWQDDPGATSVVDWTWLHKTETQAFVFIPNTVGKRRVTGNLKVVPLAIGGDEVDGADMDADFTWRVVGTPVVDALP